MKLTFKFQTIRQVLAVGFGFLILLMLGAGAVGWVSMAQMADRVTETLANAQQDAKQASDFSNVVTQEIQAANTYLSDQDNQRALARNIGESVIAYLAHYESRIGGTR